RRKRLPRPGSDFPAQEATSQARKRLPSAGSDFPGQEAASQPRKRLPSAGSGFLRRDAALCAAMRLFAPRCGDLSGPSVLESGERRAGLDGRRDLFLGRFDEQADSGERFAADVERFEDRERFVDESAGLRGAPPLEEEGGLLEGGERGVVAHLPIRELAPDLVKPRRRLVDPPCPGGDLPFEPEQADPVELVSG